MNTRKIMLLLVKNQYNNRKSLQPRYDLRHGEEYDRRGISKNFN